MPTGGSLTVAAANASVDEEFTQQHPAVPPGVYAVLRVSHTGSGAERESANRLPDSSAQGRAMGKDGFEALQALVRHAHGYLWSYNESGKGGTVSIYFPRAEDDARAASF